MGSHKNIGITNFPIQGSFLNTRVRVVFHYDTSKDVYGQVVRDDNEDPWLLIIKLDDDRHVLGTECLYQLL